MVTEAGRGHDELFRAIVETAQDAIGVSVAGTHKLVNGAYVQLFGAVSAEALVGTPILNLIAPSERERISAYVRRRMAGQPLENTYDTRGLRGNGEEFEMEVRVSPYSLDGVTHTLVILRDVSRLRREQQAIQDGQAFYKALFEVNTAVKWLVDPALGVVVDANQAAADFYGYPLEQLRGMPIHHINVSPQPQVAFFLKEAAERHRTYFQFRHRLANGSVKDVEVYSGPLMFKGRQLLFSIVHDITEKKQLEEQLRHATRMEAVGRLAGGLAHDFNNILTAVLGHGMLALEEPGVPPAVLEHLEALVQSSRRAEQLTQQLLALSGQQVTQPRALQIHSVVLDMQPVLQRLLGESVRLQLDLPEVLPPVTADPGQLEQVLLNLAVYARGSMPGGGSLTIRCVLATAPEEMGAGTCAALSVSDTAPALDAAARAHIFEPFVDARGQGTRLGLSAVYAVVQQSGGRVTLESAPGAGNTFTVYLPLAGSALTETAQTPSMPRAQRTVLLAEDNADVRGVVRTGLMRAGFHVLEASHGAAAVDVAGEYRGNIDLMVTDVMMPHLTGPEAFEKVVAARPGVRVLFISGYTDGLVQVGGAAFLHKPFTARELLDKVTQVLAAPVEAHR